MSTRNTCREHHHHFPTYGQLRQTFFPAGNASEAEKDERRRAWHKHCYRQDYPIYECWSWEYIAGLATYLKERKACYQIEGTMRVLDAGAGTGKLALGLTQACEQMGEGGGIVIDAVDNSERPMQRLFPVQEKDYREVLSAKDYTIVVCAWMPFGVDWTSDFRKKASVKEYILIGHTGDGLNGDPLRTWGYRKHDSDEEEEEDDDDEDDGGGYLPEEEREHVRDGFDRVDLPHLSKWQLCRFDNVDACSGQTGSSRTTSFRRRQHSFPSLS